MIIRWNGKEWEGVERRLYKDTPGSHLSVSRHNLSEGIAGDFDARCFEVAPGGYTSFERHDHEHFVVVLSGSGVVRLAESSAEIGPMDTVLISGQTPHQFRNESQEPLRLLCVVDRVRDRPTLMDSEAVAQASK